MKHFAPSFASLTTDGESRRKHLVREPHYVDGVQTGVAESFRGHHVLDTLPGIYRWTYFGQPVIQSLGEETLRSAPVGYLEPLNRGYLLIAYDDPALIGSTEGKQIEQRIVEHLGKDRFFSRDVALAPTTSESGHPKH